MFGLSKDEEWVFRKLSSPQKIQDFLDSLPINFEKDGETHYSPRTVLKKREAHCIEGAVFAAAILWYHGAKPLLLDLKTNGEDDEHVVALFKQNGYWGAISKTNHAVVRYRDPVYKTVRELALSYFHEYFHDETGKKILISYSRPFNMKTLGTEWITSKKDLWFLDDMLNASPHFPLVPKKNRPFIRPATHFERKVLNTREWTKEDRET